MNASDTALLGGITVTYRAGTPYVATATATLASPPPNVATNCGVCRKRSNPGGFRRSMISPNVTTGFVMVNPRFYQAAGCYTDRRASETVLREGTCAGRWVSLVRPEVGF